MVTSTGDTVNSLDEALIEHARMAAQRAKNRLGGPLTPENLHRFLTDKECLRYPTEIVFERTGLESHQCAQPFYRDDAHGKQCLLHVDPLLSNQPQFLYLVVAYMAAAINYGDAATPALAELHGSLLADMTPDVFYEKICQAADTLSLDT